jgi:hypothetical protein
MNYTAGSAVTLPLIIGFVVQAPWGLETELCGTIKYVRKVDKAALESYVVFHAASSTLSLINVPQQADVLGDALVTVEANLVDYPSRPWGSVEVPVTVKTGCVVLELTPMSFFDGLPLLEEKDNGDKIYQLSTVI